MTLSMRYLYLICAVAALTVFVGCTNGGLNLPSGVKCPDDYNPLSMSPPQTGAPYNITQDLSPSQNSIDKSMGPGNYIYTRSDIYYVDTTPAEQNPFSIHVQDVIGSDNLYHQSIACVRNAYPGMSGYAVSLYHISDFQVDPNYNFFGIQIRNFAFSVSNNVGPTSSPIAWKAPVVVQPALNFTSLDMVSAGSVAAQLPSPLQAGLFPATNDKLITQYLLKNNNIDFEIRAAYISNPNVGSPSYAYNFSVHYTYHPLAP